MENVWDYPRPPALEPCRKRVRIDFGGQTIADTSAALRILETSHPPAIYLPPGAFISGALWPAGGRGSFCEWKGDAVYFDVAGADGRQARRAAWAYPAPVAAYAALKDHVSVYPALMDGCYLDDELVQPQPGGFYGGWITKDLVGPFKGAPGTLGW